MSFSKIIDEIRGTPQYREFTCLDCGHRQKVYVLVIQGNCEQCGTEYKFRGFASIGSEIEDVIDAVLEWIGQGKEFEDAMKRKQIRDSSEE